MPPVHPGQQGYGPPGQYWHRPPNQQPQHPAAESSRSGRGRRRRTAPPPTSGLRHARPLWKRLHLPYVAALLVLLPVMLGWPYLTELDEGREHGLIPPEAQPVSEETAALAGSEWHILGYLTGYLEDHPPPPDGVELVDAGFRVTPDDEDASALLQSYCRFKAVDEDGRSWEPVTEYSMRSPADDPGSTMGGCADGEAQAIAPGAEQTFVLSFLVPEDVAEELRFEVAVATSDSEEGPRPEALLFEAEPME